MNSGALQTHRWQNEVMARPLRIEFAGAIYHVMSRGNARQDMVLDDVTPEPNQSAGMQYLNGNYASNFHRRHRLGSSLSRPFQAIPLGDRGRDGRYRPPPAQIRT